MAATNRFDCVEHVLIKLVNRWPASRIEELMPWAWAAAAKAERAQTA